jgi:flagellar FliL protein
MSKTIIIIIAAVVLLGGGGGGFYFFVMAKKPAVAKAAPPKPPPKLAYVDVKEMTMRLADSGSEHYIKLSPVLSVPVVRDRIVTVVTARTSAELSTPAGEDKLKSDVMNVLHHDFHEDVVDIYFSDYLVE